MTVVSISLQLLVVKYDPQYALRLCTEHNQTRACVLIYAAMGLYEESVDHALEVCTHQCVNIKSLGMPVLGVIGMCKCKFSSDHMFSCMGLR